MRTLKLDTLYPTPASVRLVENLIWGQEQEKAFMLKGGEMLYFYTGLGGSEEFAKPISEIFQVLVNSLAIQLGEGVQVEYAADANELAPAIDEQ
jgi:hypothetical protein